MSLLDGILIGLGAALLILCLLLGVGLVVWRLSWDSSFGHDLRDDLWQTMKRWGF